jgi:membrane associated rhomboid family serine protease
MSFGFPPFTKAVKWIVIANVAIYLLMLLAGGVAPSLREWVQLHFELSPLRVTTQGWIWQLVTYAFLHSGIMHVLWNMLGIWMFGSVFEIQWGRKQFLEYYFWCVVGAALTTIGIGYFGLLMLKASPDTPLFQLFGSVLLTRTVGASGGLFGILIAFGMIYPDREFFLFPLPFMIKAKYVVTAWILIALAGALGEGGAAGVAHFAHLGGALFGWIYLRFLPRRGLQFAASEGYYGFRNRYYRWKRRQAAKKFEVYMRGQRPEGMFDEYGNYKEPSNDKQNGESRGPWVN